MTTTFALDAGEFVAYLRNNVLESPVDTWYRLDDDTGVIKPGIHVEIDCRMRNPKTNEARRAFFHFVMCGNTNTFAWQTNQFASQIKEWDWSLFENISNHDTCWRDAIRDYLRKTYFSWADEIRGDDAPIDMQSDCSVMLQKHRLCKVYIDRDFNPDAKIMHAQYIRNVQYD